MKKLLSLGLFIIVCCGFIVGCGNKMSEEDMSNLKNQESSVYSNSTNIYTMLCDTIDYSYELFADNSKEITDANKNRILNTSKDVEMYEDVLDNISLDKLKNYHNYLVEYKGTTQEEEDIEFNKTKYKYLLSKRQLAYTKEVIELCNNDNLSGEVFDRIKNIKILQETIVSENNNYKKEVIELQNELDKKYNIDSKELYDVESKVKKSTFTY
ncbi:hypothetical protein [Terrisporobacter petrolearius]|uniref:hypothetical protein n=1 Tax=Terrisporobacter petrolearius TaxID=1460447 RepID=UPI003B00DCDD